MSARNEFYPMSARNEFYFMSARDEVYPMSARNEFYPFSGRNEFYPISVRNEFYFISARNEFYLAKYTLSTPYVDFRTDRDVDVARSLYLDLEGYECRCRSGRGGGSAPVFMLAACRLGTGGGGKGMPRGELSSD